MTVPLHAYIDDLPKPYNPPRKLRSDNLNLIEPKSDRSWGDWSFSHAAPRLWNQLPSHVKSSVSFIQFHPIYSFLMKHLHNVVVMVFFCCILVFLYLSYLILLMYQRHEHFWVDLCAL